MYIEKNGYLVMKSEEMSFFDRTGEFSDDIEDADIFEEYSLAKEFADGLNDDIKKCNSSVDVYEVVKYHKTIWLDKVGLTNEKTTIKFDDCHCGVDCVCGKADLKYDSSYNEVEEDIDE